MKLLPRGLQTAAPIPLPTRAFRVGRELPNDLPLFDADVSREHAEITGDGTQWTVRDLGSGNGTWVNDRRVEEKKLSGGDILRFGPTSEFLVVSDEPVGIPERVQSWLFRRALVARDPSFEPKRTVISSGGALIGRSAAATLRLPYGQISDAHARIEVHAGTPWVVDHNSSNGTYVNGERVRKKELRAGDEVSFADHPFDVTRTWIPTLRFRLSATGLAVLAALIVFFFSYSPAPKLETLWTRAMYEEQVERSLTDALVAYDRTPPSLEITRAQFDIAVRSLIAADRLPPGQPTDDQLMVALNRAGSDLKGLRGRDLFKIYHSLRVVEVVPEPVPEEDVVTHELNRILAEFGIDANEQPVPERLMSEVNRFVEYWTGPMAGYTRRSIERSRPHLAMIRQELRAHHLPEVLGYLPFIESGYRTEVASGAGAQGMWQFMPKTGRSYGLRVDDEVDERTDPRLSTQAACRYLDGLLSSFGANAFMCAVAAYNKGEYGMVTCLKRGASGSPGAWRSKWKFWDLVESGDGCLKPETVEYVPRFLAAAIVLRRPDAFGFEGVER